MSGRFAYHDLLRAFASEEADASEGETDRRTAVHRMLDHYLHTAHAAALLLRPARDPLALPLPMPGAITEYLGSDGPALAWLEAEHKVLSAAIACATDAGFDSHAWQLAWTLGRFLDRRGYPEEWIADSRLALTAAQRLGDITAQAHTHLDLGTALIFSGSHQDAGIHLQDALGLYQELGDHVGQALTHGYIARVFEQDHNREALAHALQALKLLQTINRRTGQADALNNVGWYHALLGNYDQTLVYCQQALDLHREIGDRHGEAATWDSVGYAHQHLGHHTQAVTCYQHAIDLCRETGDSYLQAEILTHLADSRSIVGDRQAALDALRQALIIFEDLEHPRADQVRVELSTTSGSSLL
jgi:tetratricopeptide (TPR) repeat protein